MAGVGAFKILIVHAVFLQRGFEPKGSLKGLDTVTGAISDHGGRGIRRDPVHSGDWLHLFKVGAAFKLIYRKFFAQQVH